MVEGKKVAEGRVEHTHPMIFAADSTASVGEKIGAPICDDFDLHSRNVFNGSINWVLIRIGEDSHDNYIDDEERVRIAMSIQ